SWRAASRASCSLIRWQPSDSAETTASDPTPSARATRPSIGSASPLGGFLFLQPLQLSFQRLDAPVHGIHRFLQSATGLRLCPFQGRFAYLDSAIPDLLGFAPHRLAGPGGALSHFLPRLAHRFAHLLEG